MRLESAVNCGREGITVHGQAISVVGDNIANLNTDGYKTSRTEFSDLLADGSAGGDTDTTPPVGSGVTIADIRQMFEMGVIDPTGRDLDAGIDGGGFFLVGSTTDTLYSRAGNFSVDKNGNLVNAEGLPVLGYAPGSTTLSPITMNNIQLTGRATTTATLTGNVDATLKATTVPTSPETFSDISKNASYMTTLTVYDSLGAQHTAAIAFFKTANNTFTVQAYMDGADVGGQAGKPVLIGSKEGLAFSSSGVIDAANQANAKITANAAYGNGAAAGSFTIDLSKFTQFATSSTLQSVAQDGQSAGNVQSFEIRSNGELHANLDSGSSQLVGTIILANFVNLDGLDRAGSCTFRATDDAGTRTVGTPGVGTMGKLQGQALERSNVDMSAQFVDLVIYQRGYQANSQTISAANQLLRDTLALIR